MPNFTNLGKNEDFVSSKNQVDHYLTYPVTFHVFNELSELFMQKKTEESNKTILNYNTKF